MFLLPFLWIIVPVLLGILAFLTNLWLGFSDWRSAAVFIGALSLIGIVMNSQSSWARLIVVIVIAAAGYLKGQIDGGDRIEARWTVLQQAELDRQTKIDEEAQKDAHQRVKELEASSSRLTKEEKLINEETLKDLKTSRPALSIDSIRRLNRLRIK